MDAIEVGWLAGIWDGEGHIGIQKTASKARPDHLSLTPILSLGTTCPVTRDRLIALLHKIGIENVPTYPMKRRSPRHRQAWLIRLAKRQDVAQLAAVIEPHAVTKSEHWRLLREYLSLRHPNGARRKRATPAEIACATAIRGLTQR